MSKVKRKSKNNLPKNDLSPQSENRETQIILKCNNKTNPFERFPKEIWEMILHMNDNALDILSVLQAYPELDLCFEKEKRMRLIGEVLLILCRCQKISKARILKCRLVCKQWQKEIDFSLQNQPCFRPYPHTIPIHKINPFFFNFLHSKPNYYRVRNERFFKGQFNFSERKAMEGFSEKNPFVTRHLNISPQQIINTFDFFNNFGHHLFYITLSLENAATPATKQSQKNILQMLWLAPKLKSICFEVFIPKHRHFGRVWSNLGHVLWYNPKTDISVLKKPNASLEKALEKEKLPELPDLETIEIPFDSVAISKQLVQKLVQEYSSKLRRLQIPMIYWNFENIWNLTELDLMLIRREEIPNLQKLLGSLEAPLVKLGVNFHPLEIGDDEKRVEIKIENVFKWLQRFSKLKYFSLTGNNLEPKESNGIEVVEENFCETSIPLETLIIWDSLGLTYNFLKFLPSLKHLEIRIIDKPVVTDLSDKNCVQLREHLQTLNLYESKVWEWLPRLRKIALFGIKQYDELTIDKNWHCFDRDSYEKMKRFGRIQGNLKWREDVCEMLRVNAKSRRELWRLL